MIIGKKSISGDSPCYIVAELGINHNGDLTIAKQLIDVAVKAEVSEADDRDCLYARRIGEISSKSL